jgi:hypothetical protein
MAERRCGCGHLESDHRRPFWLVAWLWHFEYVYLARPCRAVFHKDRGDVKCACVGFRPRTPAGRAADAMEADRG